MATSWVAQHSCMHIAMVSDRFGTRSNAKRRLIKTHTASWRLFKAYSAPHRLTHQLAALRHPGDIEHIFQQHRLLMESGFSYEQAALILQITQHRAVEREKQDDHHPSSTQDQLANSSRHCTEGAEASISQVQHWQHNGGVSENFEKRLSFLELEVLKQSLSTQNTSYCQPSVSSADAATSTRTPAGAPAVTGSAFTVCPSAVLEPEVADIAEALAIRHGNLGFTVLPNGRVIGASACENEPFMQQQGQHQTTSSGSWGARQCQQPPAKPWRYSDDTSSANSSRSAQQGISGFGFLPYGYQPDSSLMRGSQGSRCCDDGLAPYGGGQVSYQPSGAAIAGTVLVVYAGVLLTFLSLAMTGDGTASTVADMSYLWW